MSEVVPLQTKLTCFSLSLPKSIPGNFTDWYVFDEPPYIRFELDKHIHKSLESTIPATRLKKNPYYMFTFFYAFTIYICYLFGYIFHSLKYSGLFLGLFAIC